MAQLGLARPLHPHGSAGHLLRQPGGIPSHIVGTVVPVAACALHMRNLHLFGRQTKSQRQVAPQVVNALAVAPDFELLAWRPLRQCAAQAYRGVLQKGAVEFGAHGWQAARSSRCTRGVQDDGGLKWLRFQPGWQVLQIRHLGLAAPESPLCGFAFDFLGDLAQDMFRLGQHAQQEPVAHGVHDPGGGLQCVLQVAHVAVDHLSRQGARTEHQAVAHAGQDAVMDELEFAKHLGRNVGPDRCHGR